MTVLSDMLMLQVERCYYGRRQISKTPCMTMLQARLNVAVSCCSDSSLCTVTQAVSVADQQPASICSPTTMDVLGLRTNRPLHEEFYPITRSVSELMTFKVTPDDHRNYALTWYTLSAATGTMAYGILNKRKGRR